MTLRSRQGVKIRLNTINMLEKVQLKAPPRLPKSFGQIRETFFLAHVSQWTDSIPVWIGERKKEEETQDRDRYHPLLGVKVRRVPVRVRDGQG